MPDLLDTKLATALKIVMHPDVSPVLWAALLATPMRSNGINTPKRISAFLGQVAVESEGFTKLKEDLFYSAARLCEVWPSHFPGLVLADTCEHNPEKLANVVYANRLGNGDAASGDGWRYRGAGLIQLTGKDNQTAFAKVARIMPDKAADYCATPKGAAESACWFWTANNLNALADGLFITTITRRVNGGLLGLEQRQEFTTAVRKALLV